jgi:hypothetical protein
MLQAIDTNPKLYLPVNKGKIQVMNSMEEILTAEFNNSSAESVNMFSKPRTLTGDFNGLADKLFDVAGFENDKQYALDQRQFISYVRGIQAIELTGLEIEAIESIIGDFSMLSEFTPMLSVEGKDWNPDKGIGVGVFHCDAIKYAFFSPALIERYIIAYNVAGVQYIESIENADRIKNLLNPNKDTGGFYPDITFEAKEDTAIHQVNVGDISKWQWVPEYHSNPLIHRRDPEIVNAQQVRLGMLTFPPS